MFWFTLCLGINWKKLNCNITWCNVVISGWPRRNCSVVLPEYAKLFWASPDISSVSPDFWLKLFAGHFQNSLDMSGDSGDFRVLWKFYTVANVHPQRKASQNVSMDCVVLINFLPSLSLQLYGEISWYSAVLFFVIGWSIYHKMKIRGEKECVSKKKCCKIILCLFLILT